MAIEIQEYLEWKKYLRFAGKPTLDACSKAIFHKMPKVVLDMLITQNKDFRAFVEAVKEENWDTYKRSHGIADVLLEKKQV